MRHSLVRPGTARLTITFEFLIYRRSAGNGVAEYCRAKQGKAPSNIDKFFSCFGMVM